MWRSESDTDISRPAQRRKELSRLVTSPSELAKQVDTVPDVRSEELVQKKVKLGGRIEIGAPADLCYFRNSKALCTPRPVLPAE
jgi:hypothetical protein